MNLRTKLSNLFQSYINFYYIGTILFTLISLFYWKSYIYGSNIDPVHVFLPGFYIPLMILTVIVNHRLSKAWYGDVVTFFCLMNLFVFPFLFVKWIKKSFVSYTHILNSISLFILLTIWFHQLSFHTSFLLSSLIKGGIIFIFASILVFWKPKLNTSIYISEEDYYDDEQIIYDGPNIDKKTGVF